MEKCQVARKIYGRGISLRLKIKNLDKNSTRQGISLDRMNNSVKILRRYGVTALRRYGVTALRRYGVTALRRYGVTALRRGISLCH